MWNYKPFVVVLPRYTPCNSILVGKVSYCWNALVYMYSKCVGGLICRMWWSPWRMDYLQGSLCTGYVLWEHEHGEDALNLMNIYLKTGGSFRAVEKDKKCTTVSENMVRNMLPQLIHWWWFCILWKVKCGSFFFHVFRLRWQGNSTI